MNRTNKKAAPKGINWLLFLIIFVFVPALIAALPYIAYERVLSSNTSIGLDGLGTVFYAASLAKQLLYVSYIVLPVIALIGCFFVKKRNGRLYHYMLVLLPVMGVAVVTATPIVLNAIHENSPDGHRYSENVTLCDDFLAFWEYNHTLSAFDDYRKDGIAYTKNEQEIIALHSRYDRFKTEAFPLYASVCTTGSMSEEDVDRLQGFWSRYKAFESDRDTLADTVWLDDIVAKLSVVNQLESSGDAQQASKYSDSNINGLAFSWMSVLQCSKNNDCRVKWVHQVSGEEKSTSDLIDHLQKP